MNSYEDTKIRQIRRERRLRKRREQMKKHGKSLAMIYQNVTLKRLKLTSSAKKQRR